MATPDSLDPAAVNNSHDWTVIHLLHAGLLRLGLGESALDYQLDLAEKWEVDEVGQMYTFTLRPDITCSDGTTITADDMKFSLDRAKAFARGWSGPFYLSEIESVTSGAFLLRANNNYSQPPGIDQVHIIFHANSDEALNAYDAGEVHVMGSLKTSVPKKGFTYPDLNRHGQSSDVRYLGFNHTRLPFDDPQVRLAVAHAINRDELIMAIGGEAGVTTRIVPPGVPYSLQGLDFQIGFDPDEALKLLDGVQQVPDLALYFAQESCVTN